MCFSIDYTVKSLNSGLLWVLKDLSVIKRYPLLEVSLKFGTNILPAVQDMSAIWDVRYWGFHCNLGIIFRS